MRTLAHVQDLEQLRATLVDDISAGDERRLRLYAAVYDALGAEPPYDRSESPSARAADETLVGLPDSLRPPHDQDLAEVLDREAASREHYTWEEAQARVLRELRADRG